MALSGGGFKLDGCSGGTLPVLLLVPALGGAVVPLAVCLVWLGMALGGSRVIGEWLDGGAFVASGIVLMMVGARDSVFVVGNFVIVKRYAPGVSGWSAEV